MITECDVVKSQVVFFIVGVVLLNVFDAKQITREFVCFRLRTQRQRHFLFHIQGKLFSAPTAEAEKEFRRLRYVSSEIGSARFSRVREKKMGQTSTSMSRLHHFRPEPVRMGLGALPCRAVQTHTPHRAPTRTPRGRGEQMQTQLRTQQASEAERARALVAGKRKTEVRSSTRLVACELCAALLVAAHVGAATRCSPSVVLCACRRQMRLNTESYVYAHASSWLRCALTPSIPPPLSPLAARRWAATQNTAPHVRKV